MLKLFRDFLEHVTKPTLKGKKPKTIIKSIRIYLLFISIILMDKDQLSTEIKKKHE